MSNSENAAREKIGVPPDRREHRRRVAPEIYFRLRAETGEAS